MKNLEEKILKNLKAKKQENLRILMQWSYKDLYELENEYWEAYKTYNSRVIYEKFLLVDEAITIKKGNDEEIWDFLT